MKEFKGTQGDWKLGSTRSNNNYKLATSSDLDIVSIDVDGHEGHIMLFGDNDENHKANAKLIAAAPKLLKALQGLLKLTETLHHPSIDYSNGVARQAINEAL